MRHPPERAWLLSWQILCLLGAPNREPHITCLGFEVVIEGGLLVVVGFGIARPVRWRGALGALASSPAVEHKVRPPAVGDEAGHGAGPEGATDAETVPCPICF